MMEERQTITTLPIPSSWPRETVSIISAMKFIVPCCTAITGKVTTHNKGSIVVFLSQFWHLKQGRTSSSQSYPHWVCNFRRDGHNESIDLFKSWDWLRITMLLSFSHKARKTKDVFFLIFSKYWRLQSSCFCSLITYICGHLPVSAINNRTVNKTLSFSLYSLIIVCLEWLSNLYCFNIKLLWRRECLPLHMLGDLCKDM